MCGLLINDMFQYKINRYMQVKFKMIARVVSGKSCSHFCA